MIANGITELVVIATSAIVDHLRQFDSLPDIHGQSEFVATTLNRGINRLNF